MEETIVFDIYTISKGKIFAQTPIKQTLALTLLAAFIHPIVITLSGQSLSYGK
jgi:hypothetical protein